MTLIQKFSNYFKKNLNFYSFFKFLRQKTIGFNYKIITSIILILTLIFFGSTNYFTQKNQLSKNNFEEVTKSNEFSNLTSYLVSKINSPYKKINYSIKSNDSLEKILKRINIKQSDISVISFKLKQKGLSNIYSGRELSLVLKKLNDGSNSLINLVFPIDNKTFVEIRKTKEDFIVRENMLRLEKKEVVVKNIIKNNLYSSAITAKIEPNIIIEFARVFGFEVDFQRDIRKGDWFEIYYEKFVDDNGKIRDTGKIIYASMSINGRKVNLYNFKYKNEPEEYYDINGKSITKSLMKTPINGARLSSSFGMRKHPILGYNKMHKGTDFAAPSGTPIMASGSGTVTRARWCGGGGNCVKIRHNSSYETVYAHMKSFAKGVKEGKKVKQGQIIGYVGSTGLSTGPHLHYEVIVNGKKVNSQRLKLPSGKILKGQERSEFEIKRIKIDLQLAKLRKR